MTTGGSKQREINRAFHYRRWLGTFIIHTVFIYANNDAAQARRHRQRSTPSAELCFRRVFVDVTRDGGGARHVYRGKKSSRQ